MRNLVFYHVLLLFIASTIFHTVFDYYCYYIVISTQAHTVVGRDPLAPLGL